MISDYLEAANKIRASSLLDVDYYLSANLDVAQTGIDPLQHYILFGSNEGRRPSRSFDPNIYRLLVAGTEPQEMKEPLLDFIDRIEEPASAGLAAEMTALIDAMDRIQATGEFDAAFYIAHYGIENDAAKALAHYLVTGWRAGFKPNHWFEPAFYRGRYHDILKADCEPFLHFLMFGRAEGRACSRADPASGTAMERMEIAEIVGTSLFDEAFYRDALLAPLDGVDLLEHYLSIGHHSFLRPSEAFDPIFYLASHPEARHSDLNPLIHYVRVGRALGYEPLATADFHWNEAHYIPDHDVHIERLYAKSFFSRLGVEGPHSELTGTEEAAIDRLASMRPVHMAEGDTVDVSIVVPVYGQLMALLSCLDSLAKHRTRYRCEFIVFDDASPEGSKIDAIRSIPWIRYEHGGANRGFIGACNAAARLSSGKYLVLLNSDTRVCMGWLDQLIGSFDNFPEAGLVGSKLYNDDGSLQEAGAIVWNDGSAWNYGRGDQAGLPQYGYARQTDYCSGAAIAMPLALWQELDGFDDHFAPAYYEDVDIAFRVRAAGRQVWFQPLARVIHYEGLTHGRDETQGVKAYQVVNAQKFLLRWSDQLRGHGANGHQPLAMSDRTAKRRLLALDAVTPTPDQDAGSVMTVKLLQIFQKLGWHVSFAPVHDPRYEPTYARQLQSVGIEVLSSVQRFDLEAVLRQRPGFYEAVLGFRVTVFSDLIETVRRLEPTALALFHDIDLHYLREKREAEIEGSPLLRRRAELTQNAEFQLLSAVDCTIVPSTVERDIIERELGVSNVVVYSYTADVVRSAVPFEDRRDIVFIGGFRHKPNVDAMQFFIKDVWPGLRPSLPQGTRLIIIGADAPDDLLAMGSDDVVFTGYLEDLGPTLDTCRIFVTPLRYGAGLKGKVVTSLSFGVPCVASPIAIEGMELIPETHVLQAIEADEYRDQVLRLYNDPDLWRDLQSAGYAFVDEHYSWKTGFAVAEDIAATAERGWLQRIERERAKLVERARPI